MNTLIEPLAAVGAGPSFEAREFAILRQKLRFELDFVTQSLHGQTELEIVPQSKVLRRIHLNCRQCDIESVAIEGKSANFVYNDPYKRLAPHPGWDIHQYHQYKDRLDASLGDKSREELIIDVPKRVVVKEAGQGATGVQDLSLTKSRTNPDLASLGGEEYQSGYQTMRLVIDFAVKNVRDGLQFVGLSREDKRYPCVYTLNTLSAGSGCCLFPCIDEMTERIEWDIQFKYPKTLGDALRPQGNEEDESTGNDDNNLGLSEAERALEMTVLCSGRLYEDSEDHMDPTKKVITYTTGEVFCSANQIGFAVGPFEQVDLSDLRELDEDEKLAEDAVQIVAYCPPGRTEEVKNTALPTAKAIDFFTERFTKYFYPTYSMCFVDDLPSDTVTTAGFSFISTRLLFPQDIVDPIYENTHKVVHALAAQYSGIGVTPREDADRWCIIGMAYFMTDMFMRGLCGNNEYRFRQKLAVDRIFELDQARPSLHSLGSLLELDPSEHEFIALKAAVVLFILDRRLTKSSTSSGVARIINKVMTTTKGGDVDATLLSTAQFQKNCERIGHTKLDSFFNQWVYGAGCPNFRVSQRFNKKKLVVEMTIDQIQNKPDAPAPNTELNPDFFLRDVNEDIHEVWASQANTFTGPMTIRIHEADGTPYEHIVDIKEATQKLEIPYNTKYKRLKRNRRHKDRGSSSNNANQEASTGDDKDDVLLYCLGDVLQSQEEMEDWRLVEWGPDQEKDMSEDSYEWIRMDADFEWICKMRIGMPPWMHVSQLQQDRDVVAQYESLQYMAEQGAHPLISTFLARTIMDNRYFHGIRTRAIELLPKQASVPGSIGLYHLKKIFSELFCAPNTFMVRPNDFSDRALYTIQCNLPKAMAKVRNNAGLVPMEVKRIFVDAIKFNDNSHSEYSDCYWVSTLMTCLAEVLVPSPDHPPVTLYDEDKAEEDAFRKDAISEIERYRRIDEWISSYQNIYSVTALQCLLQLSRANVLQPRLADFLQYTRSGNADQLRSQAFRCLTDLGKLRNGHIVRYVLHAISHDPSPYMRQQVFQLFGRGLGLVALGIDEPAKPKENVSEGLIIEEGNTDQRAEDVARKTTVEGAIKALKAELGTNQALEQGLWDAISSKTSAINELWQLLAIPEILYEPDTKLVVKLKYPRYWKVHYEGDGKLRFTNDGSVRTKPRVPLAPPANAIKLSKPSGPARKLSMKLSLSRPVNSVGEVDIGRDSNSAVQTPAMQTPRPSMPPPIQKPTMGSEQSIRHESIAKPKSEIERTPSFSARRKMVTLKVPKMKDPEYVAGLEKIVPRPPPTTESAPKKLKLNTGGSGVKKESTSPYLMATNGPAGSPSYLNGADTYEQRRQSIASSKSSGSGKRGGKRKSSERDAGDQFIRADGTLSPEIQRHKKQKLADGRTSKSATPGTTPTPQYAPISTPTPSQQFGAWDATQYAPASGNSSAQFGAWDDDMPLASVSRASTGTNAKNGRRSSTPATKRSLVVKLKVPRLKELIGHGASNSPSPAFGPIDGQKGEESLSNGNIKDETATEVTMSADAVPEAPKQEFGPILASGDGTVLESSEVKYAPVGSPGAPKMNGDSGDMTNGVERSRGSLIANGVDDPDAVADTATKANMDMLPTPAAALSTDMDMTANGSITNLEVTNGDREESVEP